MTDQQHMPLPNDPDGLVEWLRTAPSNEWCGPMLNKAADEIVALRKQTELYREYLDKARSNIRAEALEDCIRACPECADRIRALKNG